MPLKERDWIIKFSVGKFQEKDIIIDVCLLEEAGKDHWILQAQRCYPSLECFCKSKKEYRTSVELVARSIYSGLSDAIERESSFAYKEYVRQVKTCPDSV